MTIAAALLTITIRVYDLYGLPQEERPHALETAGDILAPAGVEAPFIDCQPPAPAACLEQLHAGELILRIRPDHSAHRDVLGDAVVDPDGGRNVMATVYGATVFARAFEKHVPLGTLTGRVAAHEIGHLLLGANSHSPEGLMRARWDVTRGGLDAWLFSAHDAAKMRHSLIAAHAAPRHAATVPDDVYEALGD
jgi:hypothetical protein